MGKDKSAVLSREQTDQRLTQIFKNYEGPKFDILDRNSQGIQQVQIASAESNKLYYVCYELDKKFYYVDYNPALKLPLEKKVLNLAKPLFKGAIFEYNGNKYTKTGYPLIEQDRLVRVGEAFYYPDVQAKKLEVSRLKPSQSADLYEINGELYEKKGELYIDYVDNSRIFNAKGEKLRPIQNPNIVALYPFSQPSGTNSRYTTGLEVNPRESSEAFQIRMKDPFWGKTKSQDSLNVTLNVESRSGELPNKYDITLKRTEDGSFISEPHVLSYLQAKPGDRLSVSYFTLEGKEVTVPLGAVTIDKVIELDVFVPWDGDLAYNMAIVEEQINSLREAMGRYSIQIKVNTFPIDTADIDLNKFSRLEIPAKLGEKFPESKGIKMIVTPGQDNQGIVFAGDVNDPKAKNSFFVAPGGHPKRKLTEDYTTKALVKITTGLDLDMYDTKRDFSVTSEMVEGVKRSSFAQSPSQTNVIPRNPTP